MRECLNILDQLGKATYVKLFGFYQTSKMLDSLVRQSIYLIQVNVIFLINDIDML